MVQIIRYISTRLNYFLWTYNPTNEWEVYPIDPIDKIKHRTNEILLNSLTVRANKSKSGKKKSVSKEDAPFERNHTRSPSLNLRKLSIDLRRPTAFRQTNR